MSKSESSKPLENNDQAMQTPALISTMQASTQGKEI